MKRLIPYLMMVTLAGAIEVPVLAQPKSTQTTAHVRVFEGPS